MKSRIPGFLSLLSLLLFLPPVSSALADREKPDREREEQAAVKEKEHREEKVEAGEKPREKPEAKAKEKPGPERPPMPEIFRRMRELHEELGEAYRERNPGRAREIQEELHELYRNAAPAGRVPMMRPPMARGPVPRVPEARPRGEHGGEPRPPHAEKEARLHHLRMAAENLERAGRPDQARELREQAGDMERGLREEMRRHHEGDPERGLHNERREREEHAGRLEAEIRELHEIVGDLRRQIGELREELHQVHRGSRDRE